MKANRIISLAVIAFCAAGCYEDYAGDYDTIACGFANQTDVRSLIVGEGMEFSTGVALAGTINNDEDRIVKISTDLSLVGSGTLSQMKNHTFSYISTLMKKVSAIDELPAAVYSLESDGGRPGYVTIKKGSHLGIINVKVDSLAFFETDRLYPHSVIPLRISEARGCEIIEGRDYSVIGVRYENMLFGNYWHGGSMDVEEGGETVERIDYHCTVPQADSKVWTLTTVAPFALTANAVSNGNNGSAAQMKLTLLPDDSIEIEPVAGASYEVTADGESYFDRSKLLQDRKIILNYKYSSGTKTYHAHDTLYFRNRIRDGVNEWQDSDSSKYE